MSGAEEPALLSERHGVLAEVIDRCLSAVEGRGTLLVVRGEAGIGKTKLLDVGARRLAAKGIAVLRAQCTDHSGRAPFLPLVEAVNHYLAHEPSSRMQELWRVYLDRHPELHFLFGGGSRGPADPALWITHLYLQLWEALAQLGRQRGALVLILDDFHLIDASSLGFLDFLTHRMEGLHLTILLALRPEEIPGRDDLQRFLHEASAAGGLGTVELGPLTPLGTAEFIAEATGRQPEGALVARLHEGAGGNPLFLRELLGQGTPPGPRRAEPRLGDLLLARFYGLDPDLQEFLRAAAVGGDAISLEALQGAAPDPAALHRLLWAAIQKGFLEETTSPYGRVVRFRHRLMRQAILDQVPQTERRGHRYGLGLALERALGHRRLAHEVYELAHYFRDGPDRHRAARYLYLAGTMADDAHAIPVALEYYGALAEGRLMEELTAEQRYRVRFRSAQLHYWRGDTGAAVHQLELLKEFPDEASKVRALAWRGYFLMGDLRFREGLAVGRRAVGLGRGRREGLHAKAMLASALVLSSQFGEARRLIKEIEREWKGYRWNYEDKVLFTGLLIDAALISTDLRRVVGPVKARLGLARANHDPMREADAYAVLTLIYADLDQPSRAWEYSGKALEMAATWRLVDVEMEIVVERAALEARLGRNLDGAVEACAGVLERMRAQGTRRLIPATVARIVELLVLAGRPGEATRYLPLLDDYVGEGGRMAKACLYHYTYGVAHLAQGDARQALRHFRRAEAAGVDVADTPFPIDLELGLAHAELALGRPSRAHDHARRALALASRQRPVRGRAEALAILAQVEALAGRMGKARGKLEEARDLLRGAGYVPLAQRIEALATTLPPASAPPSSPLPGPGAKH